MDVKNARTQNGHHISVLFISFALFQCQALLSDKITGNAVNDIEGTTEVSILPGGQILNQGKYLFRNIFPERLEDEIKFGWPKQ